MKIKKPEEIDGKIEIYLDNYYRNIKTVFNHISQYPNWKLYNIEHYLRILREMERILEENSVIIRWACFSTKRHKTLVGKCFDEMENLCCFLINVG